MDVILKMESHSAGKTWQLSDDCRMVENNSELGDEQ
jgi:hypothetical protein